MNCILPLFFVLAVIPTHSLKLLTIGDDAPIDLEDSEEWEADIQFAYKPAAGKCKAEGTDGNFKLIVGGKGKDAGFSAAEKWFGEAKCEAVNGNSPQDVKKYCDIPNGGTAKGKFEVIGPKLPTFLAQKKKSCPHYTAKLLTMMNRIHAANKKVVVDAFDINTATCLVRTFKGQGASEPAVNASFGSYCYSKAGIAWAKNDPKVKNMDGEEFEIMATGTFSLLTLKNRNSEKMLLEVAATIDRAGTRCGATYIQNVTLQGQWVEDAGVPQIQFRAISAVAKRKALEVNFGGSWQPASTNWQYAAVQQAGAKKIVLKLNKVRVFVSVDSHRIHEGGTKTRRYANFLNVNFDGISMLSDIYIGGLLGRDSHDEAADLPEGCESSELLADEDDDKMLSEIRIA